MKVLITAIFVAATVSVIFADDNSEWEQYKTTNNLQFSAAQEADAKANFLKLLKQIQESQNSGLTRSGEQHIGQKITENSHIAPEKFFHGATGHIEPQIINQNNRQITICTSAKPVSMSYCPTSYTMPTNLPNPVPTNFDWRNFTGVVQPVANQNPCGCCYIFSGIAVLEGQLALRYNKPVKLSEEYARDCLWTSKYATNTKNSCQGGAAMNVWQFASTTGLQTSANYPFHLDDSTYQCPTVAAGTTLINVNVTGLATSSNASLYQQLLMAVGPLAIAIDASELASGKWVSWNGISPAVYPATGCSKTTTNHAVTLVGWGEDSVNGKYWIIKNSWGTTWGDKGFFKMPRGVNACASELSVMWSCIDGNCFPPHNVALQVTG